MPFSTDFRAMSFDPRDTFGPQVAATYDDAPRGDEAAAVARLAELAGAGPALEMVIGTGRIALPLAATGVPVKCHVRLGAGGVAVDPLALRYIWPSELDLMARLAGLRLRERWGGWSGEPFDGRSLRHVSVYGPA
jgi:hypothetical protein